MNFFERTDELAYDITDLVEVTYIWDTKKPEDTDNTKDPCETWKKLTGPSINEFPPEWLNPNDFMKIDNNTANLGYKLLKNYLDITICLNYQISIYF